jgi:transcription antitermination factor NusG
LRFDLNGSEQSTRRYESTDMSGSLHNLNTNWFALYTTSRHEKRVAQHLCQRQIEFFLPLYQSQRKWNNGLKVTLELPLFPGYLFVRIQRSQRVAVLSVPGALAVVGGTGGEPAALPEGTVDALRRVLELRAAEPHPLMTAGQRARVHTGPLAGLEGVVVRSKGNFRVVITVAHIMKSFSAEVDLENLEPLPSNLT